MAWRRETHSAMFPNDDTAMITHDFPLRPNLIVRLVLPVGLTIADAARLTGFINTLAFEPTEVAPEPKETPQPRPSRSTPPGLAGHPAHTPGDSQ